MLATLEAIVTQAGGTWAFCDTDSMAIVATETGGTLDYIDHTGERRTIPVLSWEQVQEIVRRFEALNPYSFAGSVLEVEDENYELDATDPERKHVLKDKPRQAWCYAISSKRYGLYNLDQRGEPVLRSIIDDPDESGEDGDENPDAPGGLRKFSEHGLGHLRNPADPESESREWIRQTWEWIIRETHGLDAPEPDWLDEMAVTRWTITTRQYLNPFLKLNRKRPVFDRIRPHNFLLVAHTDHPPPGYDDKLFLLVAPFEPDRHKWRKLEWINAHDGTRWRPSPSRKPSGARTLTRLSSSPAR